MKQKSRSHAYVYTYHMNDHVDDLDQQQDVVDKFANLSCKYQIMAHEFGADNDTYHIQGYIYFKDAKSFNAVKKLLPPSTHIEARKGSNADAMLYCMKEGVFWEYGEPPVQGKRTDLDVIYERIRQGWTLKHIATVYPKQYSLYFRSLGQYKKWVLADKEKDPLIVLYIRSNRKSVCELQKLKQRYEKGEIMEISYYHSDDADKVYEYYYSKEYALITYPCLTIEQVKEMEAQFLKEPEEELVLDLYDAPEPINFLKLV